MSRDACSMLHAQGRRRCCRSHLAVLRCAASRHFLDALTSGEGETSADSPKAPATPTIDPQAAADGWALPKSSSSKKKPGQRGVGKFKRQVSDTPTDDYEEDEVSGAGTTPDMSPR